jgi:D-alanine-D-alanine ligase
MVGTISGTADRFGLLTPSLRFRHASWSGTERIDDRGSAPKISPEDPETDMPADVERILVACGGDSPERDVSLRRGAAVCQALAEDGWASELLTLQTPKDVLPLLREGTAVFVALHGGWGEDGRLQALLEMAGVPYTGSGPEGCMRAMDKVVSKLLFRQYGIPTAAFTLLHSGEAHSGAALCALARRVAEGEALVVKPSDAGSTVGVTIVRKEEELGDAVREAERFGGTVLVEDKKSGKELTVTGCGTMEAARRHCRRRDFPKVLSTPTRRKIPPFPEKISSPSPLDEKTADKVRRVAEEAIGNAVRDLQPGGSSP